MAKLSRCDPSIFLLRSSYSSTLSALTSPHNITENLYDADLSHSGGKPSTSTVALASSLFVPVVSIVIAGVPCPLTIFPQEEVVQLNVGLSVSVTLATLTVKVIYPPQTFASSLFPIQSRIAMEDPGV